MTLAAGSSPVTVEQIFEEVQTNLYESKLRWFTQNDIFASMQEAYNKLVAILCPIEKTTFIPQISSPYYDLAAQIPDYMYLSAIYNPATLLWLDGMSYRLMKATYQTYLAIGNPAYFNVMDLRRVLIWPYMPMASGALFVVYKAKAPQIYIPPVTESGEAYYDADHIPLFPYSVTKQLLEYFTTADLMEQAREFKKAQIWWDKLLKAPPDQTSVLQQAKKEIADLARADHETVLEPFRWIFHGGASGNVIWINNETPTGTIDGVNTVFTLAQIPNPTSSLILTKNGQILYSGLGYNINGQTITIQSGYIPQPATDQDPVGDKLRVWYQIQ